MRTLSLAALALVVVACGSRTNTLPDGGRERVNCTPEFAELVVKVVDSTSTPVQGATVTAKNVGTGKTVIATTDGAGATRAVNEDIGTGTVRLSASNADGMSQTAQVEFSCGECSCSVSPPNVTLVLSP